MFDDRQPHRERPADMAAHVPGFAVHYADSREDAYSSVCEGGASLLILLGGEVECDVVPRPLPHRLRAQRGSPTFPEVLKARGYAP